MLIKDKNGLYIKDWMLFRHVQLVAYITRQVYFALSVEYSNTIFKNSIFKLSGCFPRTRGFPDGEPARSGESQACRQLGRSSESARTWTWWGGTWITFVSQISLTIFEFKTKVAALYRERTFKILKLLAVCWTSNVASVSSDKYGPPLATVYLFSYNESKAFQCQWNSNSKHVADHLTAISAT